MDAGAPKGKAKSDINVTPLIDIVLVLLIVFIVMVPGLSKAANVVVPQVVQTPTPPKPNPDDVPIVVTVDKDGKYYLQSDEITLDELTNKLTVQVKLQPINSRKVTLKVDEDMKFQYAVDALDAIRKASDQAKKDTLADASYQGMDGGDVKVPIAVKKKAS